MPRKILAGVGLLLVSIVSACRPPAEKEGLIRLIDALRREDMRRSPFLEPQPAGLKDIFFPYHSVALPGADAENPFGLKRNMHRGGVDFDILFAPPTSEYVIGLQPGRALSLDFGLGIIADAHAERLRGKSGTVREQVVFDIILENDRGKKTVFNKSLTVPASAPESRLALTEHNLALPAFALPSRVAFRTRGADKAFAFWMNPVFYCRQRRPAGVILISLDTLRPDHLGCYGYSRPTSPHLDQLSKESVLFKRAYAPSSWTLPSHVSMLTGMSTARHRTVRPESRMDPAIVTLADTLSQAGFYCAAFTGGMFLSPSYGFARGFDFYSEQEGSSFLVDSAERLASAAGRWLEHRGDRKFFLFLHTYQIHDPYAAPPPYGRMFLEEGAEWGELRASRYFKDSLAYRPFSEAQRQNIIGLYDAQIRYADDKLIKPLIQALRRLGLYETTLLILTSDHGEEFYEHQAWVHFRQLYEESIRVPLLIKFPEGRFRGREVEGPVGLIDLMPTALDVLGVDRTPGGMDGESLLAAIKKGHSGNRTLLAELEANSEDSVKKCLIQGWSKLIRNDFISEQSLTNPFYPAPRRPPLELYLLAEDPGERSNALARQPELARNMADLLKGIVAAFPQRLGHPVELDQDLRENLRALGYIR